MCADPKSSELRPTALPNVSFWDYGSCRDIEGDWSPFQPAIERFIRDGLLETHGNRLRLTSRGVLLSNEVFAEFVGVPA